MNKLTLGVLTTFIVVFGGSYIAIQLYQNYISAENAKEYNQTCFDYGLNLTEMMQGDLTSNVSGCTCRFGSHIERLTCLCDCELKDFPVQSCYMLDGCYVSEGRCYCTYSVSFE
jgi:hypothetical protein